MEGCGGIFWGGRGKENNENTNTPPQASRKSSMTTKREKTTQ